MKKRKFAVNEFRNLIMPGMLLAAVIVVILSSFGLKMIEEAKEQVTNDYMADVKELSQIYNKQLYAIDTVASLISREAISKGDLFDASVIDSLKAASEAESISNIYVVSNDFRAADSKGMTYDDISDNKAIADAVKNKTIPGKFVATENGEQRLYLCRSIITDKTIAGYVIIEYVPKMLEEVINTPKYTVRKTFALISSAGDVIEIVGKETSLCRAGDNIVKNAEKFNFITGSGSEFRQTLFDCKSGSHQIIYQGEGKYLYYTPLERCKGLVVMIVDYGDVERSYNAVSKSIRSMLVAIGIAIAVFIAVFAVIGLFNNFRYNLESEDLMNKANTDQLTDLYNKMATERMIRDYIDKSGENACGIMFILDIDNFKKINDTMGHAFGDKVLLNLGHDIKAWFRMDDIVGRIGGDEFMIFIKDVKDPDILTREGSRIMQFFEGFSVGEYTRYSPPASIGGAVYPTDAKDFEALYKAADMAVYKAKRDGKNRVAYYKDINSVERASIPPKER